MLPSVKNKQTLDILRKLKARGAPPPSADMQVDVLAGMDEEPGMEEVSPMGEVQDTSIPGVLTPKKMATKKKPQDQY